MYHSILKALVLHFSLVIISSPVISQVNPVLNELQMKKAELLGQIDFELDYSTWDSPKNLLDKNDQTNVVKLREDLNFLIAQIQLRDKIEYVDLAYKIHLMIYEGDRISLNYQALKNNSSSLKLAVTLASLSNPTSEDLGFNFIDEVMRLAESSLLRGLDDAVKSKKKGFLTGLIKNPFVQSLLNTTPIGGIVSSLVNSIKSRSETFIEEIDGKIPSNAKKLVLGTRNYFDSTKVNQFQESLTQYVNLYSKLDQATKVYLAGIDEVESELSKLEGSSQTFYSSFLQDLGVSRDMNSVQMVQRIDEIIPTTLDPDKPYHASEIVKNPDVQNSVAHWDKYIEIIFRQKKTSIQLVSLLEVYFADVSFALNEFSKQSVSQDIKNKIEGLISQLKNYTNENMDVTEMESPIYRDIFMSTQN